MNDIETARANLDHSESCNIARSKEASRFWNTKMADLPCLPDCTHAALSRIEARIETLVAALAQSNENMGREMAQRGAAEARIAELEAALRELVEASDLETVEAYKDQTVIAPVEFFQAARAALEGKDQP